MSITRFNPPFRALTPPQWRGACAAVRRRRAEPRHRDLGPDQFVVSLRHYRPADCELSRERLKAALSTVEGLLLQPRGEGELIELSDDEAVAAAVMVPMMAADRLAPSASSHTGGAFKRNVRGVV